MAESREDVIIDEDVLFRAIRDYKSASSEQSHILKIRKVQPHEGPQENTSSPYTPKIISIGPLHHGKPELQPMEDFKHKYLNKLLDRGNGDDLLRKFIEAARMMEEEVRGSYELSNTFIESDDFVRMLVIDGCFLLEFLFHGSRGTIILKFDRNNDELEWQRKPISHDILLFENQIPFFVLERFYEIAREHGVYSRDLNSNTVDDMVRLAFRYLDSNEKWENNTPFLASSCDESIFTTYSERKPSNLLHFYHKMLFNKAPQPQHLTCILSLKKWTMALFSCLFVIVSSPLYFIHKIFFANNVYPTNLTSATEIEEAGVILQGSPMDLRFEEGTLKIPVLTLNHQNLRLLKNLMIFEFYYRSASPYVHSYVSYLSDLIKKPGDLKVMGKNHIIITSGSEEESFRLVNDLIQAGFENHVPPITFAEPMPLGWQPWFSIWYNLESYCEKPRRRWRAKLIKDYFGNLWSTLGVLVAVILLVLTTLQTVFTMLPYYQ